MKIELRDIVTRSELVTWKEMTALGDDASVYESMIARWQKDLDAALSKRDKEQVKHKEARSRSAELIAKWVAGVVLAMVVLWGGTTLIGGWVGAYNAKQEAEYNRNLASGLFPFGVRTGNSQVKDAPAGVTLEAMESEDTSAAFSTSSVLRYTLNLPQAGENKVYAVSHELIDDGKVVNTGLFYTNPGEHGLSRFEKKVDTSAQGQEFDWLKITVRVVDAGSVPKKG